VEGEGGVIFWISDGGLAVQKLLNRELFFALTTPSTRDDVLIHVLTLKRVILAGTALLG